MSPSSMTLDHQLNCRVNGDAQVYAASLPRQCDQKYSGHTCIVYMQKLNNFYPRI
ncbi:unnamed protein product [Brassica oleracea]